MVSDAASDDSRVEPDGAEIGIGDAGPDASATDASLDADAAD